jgi:hypothetical protein
LNEATPRASGDDRLAVDQKRVCLPRGRGGSDRPIARRPVVPVAGKQGHARAVPPHHQAVTVMLDLVSQSGAGGRGLDR